MSALADRLIEMGVTLPPAPKPAGAYIPVRRIGNLAVTAGCLPLEAGVLRWPGRLGDSIGVEEGREAARLAALNAIAALHQSVGLDHIRSVVRLEGYVAATPEFAQHPAVVNGASEFIGALFGDAGAHARVAVGCASLPLGACVEIAIWAETA
jgi:enamine deaminase RidA (YjgF/YER057c/UK114 family)